MQRAQRAWRRTCAQRLPLHRGRQVGGAHKVLGDRHGGLQVEHAVPPAWLGGNGGKAAGRGRSMHGLLRMRSRPANQPGTQAAAGVAHAAREKAASGRTRRAGVTRARAAGVQQPRALASMHACTSMPAARARTSRHKDCVPRLLHQLQRLLLWRQLREDLQVPLQRGGGLQGKQGRAGRQRHPASLLSIAGTACQRQDSQGLPRPSPAVGKALQAGRGSAAEQVCGQEARIGGKRRSGDARRRGQQHEVWSMWTHTHAAVMGALVRATGKERVLGKAC